MAKFTFTSPEGEKYTVTAPDGATQEQAFEHLQGQIKSEKSADNTHAARPVTSKPKGIDAPNWLEEKIGNLPSMNSNFVSNVQSAVAGAADPIVGAIQLGANAIGIGDNINANIYNKEREIESNRDSSGRTGFDGSRIVGNVISPANLAIASKVAPALTSGARAIQGLKLGFLGGATAPVTNGGDSYIKDKSLQSIGGAIGGAVLSPIAGKIGDLLGAGIDKIRRFKNPVTATVNDIDTVITQALSEVKQTINDVDPALLAGLRQQVSESLKFGKKLDVSAAFRKADFDSLGMPSLTGQITRDPILYAKELNLRGVNGVGEPIQRVMANQDNILQNKVSAFKDGASEAYPAGVQLTNTLSNFDESLRKKVSGLYTDARNSTGKDLDVPLQGLAQDFAEVLHNFGDKVPSGVRNNFKALGLDGGTQLKTFSIEGADNLLKVINGNKGNDAATNEALRLLNIAVKKAVTDIDATGGAYAPAVKAASDRFKLQDAIPALKAASHGDIAPDDFVKKFIINGKTEEVNKLGRLLSSTDMDSYNQARAQIGAALYKAAFGNNAAGDKSLAAERFGTELNKYGTNKLSAFFTKTEINEMKAIERVAAYKSSTPSNAAVNYSNSASAVANLLKKIPGVPAVVSIAGAAKNTIDDSRIVNSSISAKIPSNASITPETQNLLGRFVNGGTFGLTSGAVRQ